MDHLNHHRHYLLHRHHHDRWVHVHVRVRCTAWHVHVRAVHVSCSIHRLVSGLEALACMEVMASSLEALVHYACL